MKGYQLRSDSSSGHFQPNFSFRALLRQVVTQGCSPTPPDMVGFVPCRMKIDTRHLKISSRSSAGSDWSVPDTAVRIAPPEAVPEMAQAADVKVCGDDEPNT
eukprot:5484280-Amphidinium_carterae.1